MHNAHVHRRPTAAENSHRMALTSWRISAYVTPPPPSRRRGEGGEAGRISRKATGRCG